jgi:lysophospholipase L1-like esterase
MRLFTFAACIGFVVIACSSGGSDSNGHAGDGGGGDNGTPGIVDAGSDNDAGQESEPAATMHIVGRYDDSHRFSWPGTQIRAKFSGTGVTLSLNEMCTDWFDGCDWFDVTIDGVALDPLVFTTSESGNYVLAENLADGEHDLVVAKRTESSVGVAQFLGITAEGGDLIETTLSFSHRLEFIGDSISCGYGVLGANEDCDFSPDTESEPLAYPALTAAALNALHTTVAYSGKGVVRESGSEDSDPQAMPVLYMRTLADDPTSQWDFRDVPDAVIINLGTNDFSVSDPGSAFISTYVDFMATVRSKYPAAHIMVALSPMIPENYPFKGARATLQDYLKQVISKRQEAGDMNVSMIEFDVLQDADYGCNYHPNKAAHQRMSDQLVAALRAQLGR